MTCGIYKLNFPRTGLVYIGKSINIERRFNQHINKFKSNKYGNSKLQWAYNLYGIPTYEILHVCKESDLDFQEIQYISLFNSLDKGLNSIPGGQPTPVMSGIANPNAQYKEEDYFNVLYFLGEPGYSITEIAELTNVSKYVVQHIASREAHFWLKDKYPELYNKMVEVSTKGRRSSEQRGIIYPLIKSPSGEIYEVKHQTNFAKEHGLLQSKLCEVLHGNRKRHLGWTLAEA